MSGDNIDCDSCLDPQFNTLCPPRMSDGRMFTDYRPRCFSNKIDSENHLDSHNYRMYLTNNAENIIKQNMMNAHKNNKCVQKVDNFTTLPHAYNQECNTNTCSFTQIDESGLGLQK